MKKHLHANQKVTVLSPISKSILKNEFFKSFSLKTAIYSAVLLSPLLFAHRAQATCLSPDPFIVQSNQTNTITNGVANDTCILSTFQVDSGYSLAVSNGDGLDNYATITNLTNAGTISVSSTDGDVVGIYNLGTITNLTNTGTISATGDDVSLGGIANYGTIGNLTNTGTISATNGGGILNLGTIGNLTNTGTILTTNGFSIANYGTIGNLTNTGTISATNNIGIFNGDFFGTIGTITNLTNTGTILATGDNSFGIYNYRGTITNLNNLQGKSINSPLTYSGTLPTNYNIIINSPTNYGQLSVTSVTGNMAFGIYPNSIVRNGTYTGVLQGFNNLNNITGTTGSFDGGSYRLVLDGSNYDLVFSNLKNTAESYADNQTVGIQFLRRQSDLLLGTAGNNCSDKTKQYCGFILGGNNISTINGQNSLASFNSQAVNTIYGVEWNPSKQWSFGAAYGYGTSSLYNFSLGYANINGQVNSGSIYGVYRPSVPLKISALFNYSGFNFQGSRVEYVNNSLASSTFGANGFSSALQVSYDIPLNNKSSQNVLHIIPNAGLFLNSFKQNAFNETGAGIMNLNVNANTSNSIVGSIGATIEMPITINNHGGTITPSLSANYNLDFLAGNTNNYNINASYSPFNDTGTVSYSGQNGGTNFLNLTAKVNITLSTDVNLYVTGNYEASNVGSSYSYSGGLRVKF